MFPLRVRQVISRRSRHNLIKNHSDSRSPPSTCAMTRSDGRSPDQLRPVAFEFGIAPHASGSVLVSMGKTRVICAVMIEEAVPRWMKEQGVTGGWLTAEYSMLPVLDAAAQTSRHHKRPRRWSQRRDSTVDWPVVARGDRFGKTRTPHDLGGLRCPASRWRNAHNRDHRREPGAGHRLPKIR